MDAQGRVPDVEQASTWPAEVVQIFDSATTGLSYPSKAERARRDPRVTLLYSDFEGSGLLLHPPVLVQGRATVHDADLQGNTDRYLRASMAKTPKVYTGLPPFLLRRLDWYVGRIWIEVTPLRMLWWSSARLDHEPSEWTAQTGTTAPPSHPAPTGPSLPPRAAPPSDWQSSAARAVRLGAPVLTLIGEDGWPLPVRCRGVRRVEHGFVVEPPAGVTLQPGAACLTFSRQNLVVGAQENVVLVGQAEPEETSWRVRVDRALFDWSITGNRLRRTVGFLSQSRQLRPRLAAEAARRGQRTPLVRLGAP